MDIGDDPGYGNAIRAGGDLDHNGYSDLIILAQELSGTFIQFDKNILYVFAENSPADSLWIKPTFPTGGENFYPGSVQFIQWNAEVPAGSTSTVDIEISAYGQQGPWWMLASNIQNNGKHQWIVPDYGSEEVFLKFTIKENNGSNSFFSATENAFTIFGNPTAIKNQKIQKPLSYVFPNPGSNYFMLSNPANIETFKLFNHNGECVLKESDETWLIKTEQLNTGIYLYQIITKDKCSYSGKWMKH